MSTTERSHFIFEDEEIVGVFINPSEVHHTKFSEEDIKSLFEFEPISLGWWHDFAPGTLGTSDAEVHLEKVISAKVGAPVRCQLFRDNGHDIGLADDVSEGVMVVTLR